MRLLTFLTILLLGDQSLLAQSGCTDPEASNYSSSAQSNDGSCVYPPSVQPFILMVNTSAVGENSGIEWVNGGIYTFGDSGNPPDLFRIDTTTGNIAQTIHITNHTNTDWEDITSDSAYVYIGDFGNNDGDRTDQAILKLKKSDFINNPASIVTASVESISITYADQTSYASVSGTNFDCESVISIRDSLYIFTKDRGDLKTRVYKLPKTPGSYTVSPYTGYNVNGKITGADYNPINNEVVLVGYESGDENSFIWYLSDFQGIDFFSGNKRKRELGNSNYSWQTEGIAFYNEISTHRIFISNERDGLDAGIYVSDVNHIFTGIPSQQMQPLTISCQPDRSILVSCPAAIKSAAVSDVLGRIDQTAETRLIDQNTLLISNTGSALPVVGILKLETMAGAVYVAKLIH